MLTKLEFAIAQMVCRRHSDRTADGMVKDQGSQAGNVMRQRFASHSSGKPTVDSDLDGVITMRASKTPFIQ